VREHIKTIYIRIISLNPREIASEERLFLLLESHCPRSGIHRSRVSIFLSLSLARLRFAFPTFPRISRSLPQRALCKSANLNTKDSLCAKRSSNSYSAAVNPICDCNPRATRRNQAVQLEKSLINTRFRRFLSLSFPHTRGRCKRTRQRERREK